MNTAQPPQTEREPQNSKDAHWARRRWIRFMSAAWTPGPSSGSAWFLFWDLMRLANDERGPADG